LNLIDLRLTEDKTESISSFPAQAGNPEKYDHNKNLWIPASAGMTAVVDYTFKRVNDCGAG
jgi:hypothetical protein